MTKLTQSDIQKIIEAQTLIQSHQRSQSIIYDTLLVNLPDLSKSEQDLLFDYVYNNQTHTISLGKDGLKLEPVFGTETFPTSEPIPDFESNIDSNKTKEDSEKAFQEFKKHRDKRG